MWINHVVFQCGARLGEDSGGEGRDTAPALGLQLGEDKVGESQVRAGFEVNTRSVFVSSAVMYLLHSL